jgi:hypothetical protein
MKKIVLFLFLMVVYFAPSYSQTPFFQDDFENSSTPDISAGSTRTPSSNGGTTTSYFKRSNNTAADISLQALFGTNYGGMSGSNIWAGEDHDTPTGNGYQQIEWTNINISGRSGIQFKGNLAANNTNGAWDNVNTGSSIATFGSGSNTATLGNDFLKIEYAIDGNPYTQLFSFWSDNLTAGTSPTSNKSLDEDTNGDFIGDGTTLNNTLTEFIKSIPGTGTVLKLRVSVFANGSSEEWAIDNFRLVEVATCNNPTLPTISATSTTNCGNVSTTLSIATGSLNSATNWQWYTSSCGGTAAGSGTSIIVNPSATTTYYVRGLGGCVSTGSCSNQVIIVNTPSTWYLDNDGDGFGAIATSQSSCTQPPNYVANNTDCDDNNSLIHQQFNAFYLDNDGDGYGVGLVQNLCAINASTAPSGYALNNTDCDDNSSIIHQQFNAFYLDNDGDGYGVGLVQNLCAINASTAPSG